MLLISFSRISTISLAELTSAAESNAELAMARSRMLELSQANLSRLEAGGPIAMAHYLTAAPRQPKLNTALQRRLQILPHLTISAVCVDCSNPPRQHVLTLNLSKSITVAATIKTIIDEQARLVQWEVGSHEVDPAPQYVLKVCCSQEYLFERESVLVHYAYVQDCLQRGDIPRLTPVLLKDVLECLCLVVPENIPVTAAPPASSSPLPLPSIIDLYGPEEEEEGMPSLDLWDLKDYFSLTVRSAQKLTSVTQTSSTVRQPAMSH